MSELFYNAAPNATRVAPPLPKPRVYPAKPSQVYLFGTCVVDLFYPEAGLDAIRLLEREGLTVHYPQGQTCCGQPAYTTGYTDEARKVARAQLELFANDWPVVVPSGSCAGMLRHHYLELFKDEPATLKQAQALAERLGVAMNLADMPDDVPRVAQVLEHLCIGCTRCFKVCPTDAVMGAAKQLHQVFGDACTACGKCQAICPTEAIQLTPVAPSLLTWGWERPLATREV